MSRQPLPPFWKNLRKNWQTQPLGSLIWKYVKQWWNDVPDDPWPEEIGEAVRSPDAVMVCHHCFEPYEDPPDFCRRCGAAIGPYNNVKPFERIFSMGEVFRNGVRPNTRHSKLALVGYALLTPLQYGFFAPLYFFRMIRNRRRKPDSDPADAPDPREPEEPG